MTDAQPTVPDPARTGEPVPTSNAYTELARRADCELREWMRRRAERRARNRHPADRGPIPE